MASNCSVAHEYADAILRGVDGGVFANIKVLFAAGKHNRIYEEVRDRSLNLHIICAIYGGERGENERGRHPFAWLARHVT